MNPMEHQEDQLFNLPVEQWNQQEVDFVMHELAFPNIDHFAYIGVEKLQYTFQNDLQKLINDIQDGNFINYSEEKYITLAKMIIDNINMTNLEPHILKLIDSLYNVIDSKIKNIDKEVTKLTDEIIEKIDKSRLYIINGKKTLLFMPQLERSCNWSYSLLSDKLVKSMGLYRGLLRYKYYMICQYIEDLLIRKSKIQIDTIKLELAVKNTFHLPIYICIQCNLLEIAKIKREVEKLVKLLNSKILMDKNRKFQIWEDWWTGTNDRKICPLYTEKIEHKYLTFGARWI